MNDILKPRLIGPSSIKQAGYGIHPNHVCNLPDMPGVHKYHYIMWFDHARRNHSGDGPYSLEKSLPQLQWLARPSNEPLVRRVIADLLSRGLVTRRRDGRRSPYTMYFVLPRDCELAIALNSSSFGDSEDDP